MFAELFSIILYCMPIEQTENIYQNICNFFALLTGYFDIFRTIFINFRSLRSNIFRVIAALTRSSRLVKPGFGLSVTRKNIALQLLQWQ